MAALETLGFKIDRARKAGAERVFVTHGQVQVMVRWLESQGLDAQSFDTEFGGEDGDGDADPTGTVA